MDAVERLRRDHAILRSKLAVLEVALGMGPETWFVLREVCFTLSRQLRDHLKREEALVVACRKAMNPKALAAVVVEHRDEPAHLRTLNRLFVSETRHSLERIRPALTDVIQGLRRHMAEEEAELFPVLERGLANQPLTPQEAPMPWTRFDEAMTVNRVVQEFPRTRSVFDRSFINVPLEGCTCLDEVAWRHGMEAKELLKQLEEEATVSCRCVGGEPTEEDERLHEPSEASLVEG
ncbi:MAG: hemerythrin domain-containing protein [Candidatus Omnitrophica bacterium]|nr:hemerythrin domain-containing protein [Candidatus Omnitrophota bacterium]